MVPTKIEIRDPKAESRTWRSQNQNAVITAKYAKCAKIEDKDFFAYLACFAVYEIEAILRAISEGTKRNQFEIQTKRASPADGWSACVQKEDNADDYPRNKRDPAS